MQTTDRAQIERTIGCLNDGSAVGARVSRLSGYNLDCAQSYCHALLRRDPMYPTRMIRRIWHFLRDEHRAIGAFAALVGVATIFVTAAAGVYVVIDARVLHHDNEEQYRLPTDEEVSGFLSGVYSATPYRGQVVTKDGDPIAGAIVRFCYSQEISDGSTDYCGVYAELESEWTGRTDSNGKFEIGFNLEIWPALVVSLGESTLVRVLTADGELSSSHSRQYGTVDERIWYSTVFDIPRPTIDRMATRLASDQQVSTVGETKSALYVERVRLFGETCDGSVDRCPADSASDAAYEFWLNNPTEQPMRVTNAGLVFRREDPGILCCCVDDLPYVYRVEIYKTIDSPGTWLEFTSASIVSKDVTADSGSPKLQSRCVSRQGCQGGIVTVSFSADIKISPGDSEKVRLIFPAGSLFRPYKYRNPDDPSQVAEGEHRRSFDAIFFDESGALVQSAPSRSS